MHFSIFERDPSARGVDRACVGSQIGTRRVIPSVDREHIKEVLLSRHGIQEGEGRFGADTSKHGISGIRWRLRTSLPLEASLFLLFPGEPKARVRRRRRRRFPKYERLGSTGGGKVVLFIHSDTVVDFLMENTFCWTCFPGQGHC